MNSLTRSCHSHAQTIWLVLVIALMCAPETGWAQAQGNFRQLDRTDGLSSESILSISQDTLGFLWIGTANGLNRFDGVRVRTFDSDPKDSATLPHSRVNSVYTSKKGDLWLGTHDGLAYYSSASDGIERIRLDGPSTQVVVHGITETRDGVLWLSTWEKGLFRFDPATSEQAWALKELEVLTPDGIVSGSVTVRTAFVRENGSLLLGGYRGVFEYDPVLEILRESPFSQKTKRILEKQVVFSIAEDNRGDLWFSSFEGVLRVDPLTGELHRYSDAVDKGWNTTYKVFVDSQGTLWAGSENGLMKYSPEKDRFDHMFYSPTDPGSILAGTITEIYEDESGVLWVGSDEGGLSSLDLYEIPVPTYVFDPLIPKRFPRGHVWDALDGPNGSILLATTAGLIKWHSDRNAFEEIGGADLRSKGVHVLFKDSRERLWVAPVSGGLCLFDVVQNRCTWIRDSEIPSGGIHAIAEGEEGRIWIGTSEGLFSLNGRSLKADIPGYRPGDDRERMESFLLSVLEDSHEQVWLGSEKGLFLKKPNDVQVQQIQLASNDGSIEPISSLIDIIEAENGTLWFLDAHVHLWDPRTNLFRKWETVPPELQFRTPLGMALDADGLMWVQFDGALVSLDESLEDVQIYPKLAGKKSLQYWAGASRLLKSGQLIFGFNDGAYAFEPGQIHPNAYRPSVLFSDLKIENAIIRPKDGDRLSSSFSSAKKLVLHHDDRSVEVAFSSSRLSEPEGNTFQYQLEGLSTAWTEAKSPVVAFSSLNPGDYTLRVKSFGPNGLESTEKTLSIEVQPPWWKTLWFRLVFLGGLVVLIAMSYRQRVRAIVASNQRLEKMVAERTQLLDEQSQQLAEQAERLLEADQSKTRFFSNVSHELKTPLTLIRGYLEELATSGAAKFTDREAKRVERSLSLTGNLDRLVLQLLDLAKSEANKLQLNTQRGELGRFVHKIVTEFSGHAESKQIKLILELEEGAIWLEYDAVKLHQVISNLISNALKFTPEKGSVWVSVALDRTENTTFALVEVADTGSGIPASVLGKVFDRFYQVENPLIPSSEGFGIGLSLSHDFTKLHGGTLEVASEVDAGSVFTIKIPVLNAATENLDKPGEVHAAQYVNIVQADQNEVAHRTATEKSTVLVVEDNVELRQYLVDLLSDIFHVRAAENGAIAWEILQKDTFDLVLSDVMMPVMDGLTLLSQIREHPVLGQMPVVLLTARGASEEELEGLEAKANDYVAKPFNSKILKARLLNLIELGAKGLMPEITPLDDGTSEEDAQFLMKLNVFIHDHISEVDLQNQDIAEAMFVSERTFQRKVKELTGNPAAAYVRKIRLQQARKYLENQEVMSMSRVSRAVGFQNVSYFTKQFMEEFGVDPGDYLS